VAHHCQHFVLRALFQQIVVQRNARRAQEAGHIGGDAIRLPGGVHQEDIVHRHVIGAGQGQYLGLERTLRQGRIMIEQGRDQARPNDDNKDLKEDCQARPPNPPLRTGAAHEPSLLRPSTTTPDLMRARSVSES